MTSVDPQFDGVYGTYTITINDRKEVTYYRIALLISGLSMTAGLFHWWQLGGKWAWIWMLPLAISLGLALKWIHIYLRTLHRTLQLFWLIGCIGFFGLLIDVGPFKALNTLGEKPLWILAIGPLFASLAGIGFKEFFCFQRPEAIGITIFLPIALIGHLLGLISGELCIVLLCTTGLMLIILALRKFSMEAGADIGDKSVFAYLEDQRQGLKT